MCVACLTTWGGGGQLECQFFSAGSLKCVTHVLLAEECNVLAGCVMC